MDDAIYSPQLRLLNIYFLLNACLYLLTDKRLRRYYIYLPIIVGQCIIIIIIIS